MVDLTQTATQQSEQLLVTDADYHIESGGALDDAIIDLYCRTSLGQKEIIQVEGFRPYFYIHHDEFLDERETLLKESRIVSVECDIRLREWDTYLDEDTLVEAETEQDYRDAVEARFAGDNVPVYHTDVRDALNSDEIRNRFPDRSLVRIVVEKPDYVAGDDGLKDNFEWTGEADIPYPNRFLIDSDVYRGMKIPIGEGRVRFENWDGASKSTNRIQEIDPCDPPTVDDELAQAWPGLDTRLQRYRDDKDDPTAEPDLPARTLTVDIEVLTEGDGFPEPDLAAKPVTAITSHDNYTDDYVTWVLDNGWDFEGDPSEFVDDGYDDPRVGVFEQDVEDELGIDADIRMFTSETTMLDDFNEWVNQRSFDIFTGWNSDGFDYPYLIQRSYEVGAYRVSEWGHGQKPFALTGRDNRDDEPYIDGVVCLDLLTAYQKTVYTELDSKRLENVADHVLGYGKADPPGEDLDEAYHQHPVEFVRYNVRDVEATVEIDRTRGVRDLFDHLRAVTGALYNACEANWQMLDILFLREAAKEEIVLPTSTVPDQSSYHGAKVFEPAPGVHKNVIYPDLASLYPYALWTLNTSPDVLYNTLEDAREAGYSEDDMVRASVDRRDWKIVPEGESFDETQINKDQYKGVKDETGSQRAIFDPHRDDVYFVKPEVEEGFIRSTIDDLIDLKDEYRGTDRYGPVKKVVNSCFTPDTEVLTPNGIHNIRDIDVGDVVYSIDPDTHTVETKEVTEVIEKPDYDGELVNVQSSKIDFSVTPDHRFHVNRHRHTDDWETTEAGELNKWSSYKLPNDWGIESGERIKTVNVTDYLDSSDYEVWVDNIPHGRTFTTEIDYSEAVIRKVTSDGTPTNGYIIPGDIYEQNRDYIHNNSHGIRVHTGEKRKWIPVEYDGDDWLELMAWYITEGSARTNEEYMSQGRFVGETSSIHLAQKSDSRVDIESLLDRMNLHGSSCVNGYTVTSKILKDTLSDLCGEDSTNKKIPDLVFEASAEQKETFFDCLIDGDGDTYSGVRYTTVSEQLKDDFAELCVHVGRNPRVREEPSSSTNHLVYRIRCSKTENEFRMERDGSTSTAENGVYCVQVEDNHTLMAGRNGNFQFIPNCYGVLGDSNTGGTGFRLFDWRIGESITLFGRTIITETAEQIERYINEHYDEDAQVVGGDTDSAMLSIPNAPDFQTALDWAHEAVDYLEGTGVHADGPGHYDELIQEEFNLDVCDPDSNDQHRMAVDIESLASRLFFQNNPDEIFDDPEEATKKRYAEHVVWDEDDGWLDVDGDYRSGPDQDEQTVLDERQDVTIADYEDGALLADQDPQDNLSITGFDYVRSDTSALTDEAQMTLFVAILLEDDPEDTIYEYITTRVEEILNGDVDLDVIGKKAGINNALEEYGWDDDLDDYKMTPGPTYRGAKYATEHIPWETITPGNKPYRIYVDDVRPGESDIELPEVYEYETFKESPEVGDEVDAISIMNPDRCPDAIYPDYPKMMEKEFKDRVEPILLTMDMTWNGLVGEGKQDRFGDGFAEVKQTKYESEPNETEQTQQTGLDAF